MNRLQETLPSAEEASLAKLCSQELSAMIETRAEAQTLSISDPRGGCARSTSRSAPCACWSMC